MYRVIKKTSLVEKFAMELACRQNDADYWYYVLNDQEMSSFLLDTIVSLNSVAISLGISKQVYDRALEIYDFRDSGKSTFVPDLDHIEKCHHDFELIRKHHPIF